MLELIRSIYTTIARLSWRYAKITFYPFEYVYHSLSSFFSQVAWFTLKFWLFVIFLFGSTLFLLFACSSLYFLVYNSLIPQLSHRLPVHLSYMSSVPHANVSLTDHHHEQYESSIKQQLIAQGVLQESSPLLTPPHHYTLTLSFSYNYHSSHEMPYYNSVTFHTQLFNQQHNTIATSIRSFIPYYSSWLVRSFYSVFFCLPLICGLMSETLSAHVVLFDDLIVGDDVTTQPTLAYISMYSRDDNKFVVDKAQLLIDVKLYGIRYVMHHWFYTCSFIVISSMLTTSFIALWSIIITLYLTFFYTNNDDEHNGEQHVLQHDEKRDDDRQANNYDALENKQSGRKKKRDIIPVKHQVLEEDDEDEEEEDDDVGVQSNDYTSHLLSTPSPSPSPSSTSHIAACPPPSSSSSSSSSAAAVKSDTKRRPHTVKSSRSPAPSSSSSSSSQPSSVKQEHDISTLSSSSSIKVKLESAPNSESSSDSSSQEHENDVHEDDDDDKQADQLLNELRKRQTKSKS